jgi:uncharacterized protein (DUF1501 family)
MEITAACCSATTAYRVVHNRDLQPTLDLRSVFKTVLDEHCTSMRIRWQNEYSPTVAARALYQG